RRPPRAPRSRSRIADIDGDELRAPQRRREPDQQQRAMHDRDCEGDVPARRHRELLDVEGRSGLVIAEKQTPGLFVRLDALALEGRGQVEPHHVRLVVSKDGGNIVPAEGTRPPFEKGFDLDLFAVRGAVAQATRICRLKPWTSTSSASLAPCGLVVSSNSLRR